MANVLPPVLPLTTRHLPITAPQRERYDALPDGWFFASDIRWLTTQRAGKLCGGLYAKRWLERRAVSPDDPRRSNGKGHLLWEWIKV